MMNEKKNIYLNDSPASPLEFPRAVFDLKRVYLPSENKSGPEFRSVQINQAPLLHQDPMPLQLLGPPPAQILRQTSLPMKSTNSGNKMSSVNDISKNFSWQVCESMIRPVPEDYDLSRSSRYINGIAASEIGYTISNCLKRLSITSSFNEKKAKAKCVTLDFVKLQVRLHRGSGDYAHGIIVETVRRCGPYMGFLKASNAILDAAGAHNKNSRPDVHNISPHMRQPVSSLKCLSEAQALSDKPLGRESEALDRIDKLLNDKNDDTHILGMESLLSLVKRSESSASMKKRAVCAVLLRMNVPGINDKISSFLNADDHDSADLEQISRLRSLSLRVIYHSFIMSPVDSVCGTISQSIKVLLGMNAWILDTLIPLLVKLAKQDNPHDALIATQTLNLWVTQCPEVRLKIMECGGLSIFELIKDGNLCEAMEIECDNMLKALR